MKTYRGVWEIDIDADSPIEAVRQALRNQRMGLNAPVLPDDAGVFRVDGKAIDLGELHPDNQAHACQSDRGPQSVARRTLRLPCYGIEIVLGPQDGVRSSGHRAGAIRSDLKEICPACGEAKCSADCQASASGVLDDDAVQRREYNAAMDGIESLILAAACCGVDIQSPAFIEAIETAPEACANNLA